MKNITGTLISLSRNSSEIQGNTSVFYAAWSSSEVDSVCQALKDLIINNASGFSVASGATNSYVLTSNALESGYAIRILGYTGSSTVASYIEIADGTWNGSTFTSKLSYKIYPFISSLSSSSNNTYYAIGYVGWSFSYVYRMVVDDAETSFVLRLAPDTVPSNPFSYATGSFSYKPLIARNSNASRSTNIMKADVSNAPLILSVLSVGGKGKLVVMEQLYQIEGRISAWLFGKGLVGNSWVTSYGPLSGHSESSISNPLYGWRMYDRDYYIATTIYPATQSSDYGSIKIVKLGCCEYGLPYITNDTYVDNLFVCERNSNLVDGQIIVIDGDKYLYSDSGYLFKLGPAGPAPSGQTVTFSVYNGDKNNYGEAYFKFDSAPSSSSDYDFRVYGGYDGGQPDVYGSIVSGGSESGVEDGSQYSGTANTLYYWGNSSAYVDVDGASTSPGTWQSPTVIPVSASMSISVTADSFDD